MGCPTVINWIIENSKTLSSLLVIIGIIFQTYSAWVFASTWLMPDKIITDVAGTYWNSNPHLLEFLQKTKNETYKGLFYLVVGMLCLIISTLMQMYLC